MNNFIEIERNLISPIADNAFSYYRYKLIGTLFDEGGRLINKIEVLPKRNEDPVFRGFIYIVEDLWNIQSTELMITGATIKQPILDTLIIKQVHVPLKDPDGWLMLSQSLDFRVAIFGFRIAGNFTGVFSNYDLEPNFDKDFFTNEIFKVERDANEKSQTYWDSIRPVPLTMEEEMDYVKKDSLEEIWESREYRDSMDRKNNKFKFGDLLFGYQYQKSFNKTYFSIGSPLTTVQFNPVQGWYGNVDIEFLRYFDEHSTKWLRIQPQIQYGLSDKSWRGGLDFAYNFNNENFSRITFGSGYNRVTQYNQNEPIAPFLNTFYSWWFKQNYMKIYEKDYLELGYRQELLNGLYFRGNIQFAQRRNDLFNTTQKAWSKKERNYFPNIPDHPVAIAEDESPLTEDKVAIADIGFRIRFDQKYISYPDQKFIMGSKFPDLWINYRKGMGDVDYDLLRVQIRDRGTLGLVGETEFNVEGGWFLNNKEMRFMDYYHFNGNQTVIFNPDQLQNSFLLLPYYERSTNDWFVQGHFQHHFNGFLLDKVPLLRKAGLKSVISASYLRTPELGDYIELSFGLENLGFGVFRIFRVDGVVSFDEWKYRKFGVRLGISL